MNDITKLCADSLRAFANDNYNIKLKATQAHELVAAFFGYRSRAALLADANYPISNLPQAKFIVIVTDALIDQRRKELCDLSPGLPETDVLSKELYKVLSSDQRLVGSQLSPFKSFDKLAKFLFENNDACKHPSPLYFQQNIPTHHFVGTKTTKSNVALTISHAYQTSESGMLLDYITIIELPRLAGHIGYGQPEVYVQTLAGQARQAFDIHWKP